MKKEGTSNSRSLSPERSQEPEAEIGSGYFPIIEDKNSYTLYREPELNEGKIIHYKKTTNFLEGDKKYDRFKLLQRIGDLHYMLSLNEYHGTYSLQFKTEEYEFAVVNLTKEESETLFRTIAGFIDSIAGVYQDINEIRVSPADSPYSREEIDKCVEEIITSPDNKLTREEIAEYKGHEVFDLYHRLFGKEFERSSQGQWRAGARARLFKAVIRKYLPEWEIVEDDYFSIGDDFVIRRK